MSEYDFDTEIDRLHTDASKWAFVQDEDNPEMQIKTDIFSGPDRALPLWVADMDFKSPQAVIDTLVARAQHGIFGYTAISDSYYEAVSSWLMRRHGWEIKQEWICTTPGVVPALKAAIRAFVPPGGKVLVQTPVYYPFFSTIIDNDAQILNNPLLHENGRYRMDFEDLAQKASQPDVHMIILCSPHNPIGRVWKETELQQLGEICLANDIIVASDELHSDLIFNNSTFTPFGRISKPFQQNSIICTAGSKTFNLAGIRASNIIIADPQKRGVYQKTLDSGGLGSINLFGTIALEAAYNHGEEWLEHLLVYIQDNYDFLCNFLAHNLPQISVTPLEGTYLAWVDFRSLGLDNKALRNLMLREARVYLDEGYIFGEGGEGFERINLACPRSILAEAVIRIANAVKMQSGDK
jgi:cystathionine beta-lyase